MYSNNNSLEISNLTCERGYKELFNDISLKVDCGEIVHIRGENGSGKSTLINAICGNFQFTIGDIRWNGKDIRSDFSDYVANIAYLGHKNGLKELLTPRENLEFFMILNGIDGNLETEEAISILNITAFLDTPIYQLSAGQKQRIALARILISNVPVWLLDEPGASLDENGIGALETMIKNHSISHGLVIYTSHQYLDFGDNIPKFVELS